MYDIIIIGGGPAGLTSAIYAGEANKKVLVLEKTIAGGQTSSINNVTNYPGFLSINGYELSLKMKEQAVAKGAVFKREEVISVSLTDEEKVIKTHKNEYRSKSVIISTGAYARSLELENEKAYLGKGLSYCATCDGNFFKDKVVTVVGGGNSSMDDCIYLSNLASKVYLIHRRDEFRANQNFIDKVKQLQNEGKVEIITNSVVTKIMGEPVLNKIEVTNKIDGSKTELKTDGLFIAIGRKPDTEIFAGQINLTNTGFIETDQRMRTSLKNVYAVGDVRNTPLRQIVTACSDGAIAVNSIIIDN